MICSRILRNVMLIFSCHSGGNGNEGDGKTAKVVINDWNFDTMLNGRFWYDLNVSVLAANGHELTQMQLKDE